MIIKNILVCHIILLSCMEILSAETFLIKGIDQAEMKLSKYVVREMSSISDSDKAVSARMKLLFSEGNNSEDISCEVDHFTIEPEYLLQKLPISKVESELETRRFEAMGGYSVVSSGETNSSYAIGFSAVNKDYEGSGRHLLIKGESYRVTFGESAERRAWLHVPDDLKEGKAYTAIWSLKKPVVSSEEGREEAEVIQGSVDAGFREEVDGELAAIYLDPETGKSVSVQVCDQGDFSLEVGKLGGPLVLYDKIDDFLFALCVIERSESLFVNFPEDADKLHDKESLVEGQINILSSVVPQRQELCIAIYDDKKSMMPIAFKGLSSEVLIKGDPGKGIGGGGDVVVSVDVSMPPGSYEIRLYQFGRKMGEAVRAGYVDLPKEVIARAMMYHTGSKSRNMYQVGTHPSSPNNNKQKK